MVEWRMVLGKDDNTVFQVVLYVSEVPILNRITIFYREEKSGCHL